VKTHLTNKKISSLVFLFVRSLFGPDQQLSGPPACRRASLSNPSLNSVSLVASIHKLWLMLTAHCLPLGDKKRTNRIGRSFFILVGTGGFEPPAPCSQGRCADQTALRPDYFYAKSLKVGDLVSQGRVQCKGKTRRVLSVVRGPLL
jgi:hypothetical protein